MGGGFVGQEELTQLIHGALLSLPDHLPSIACPPCPSLDVVMMYLGSPDPSIVEVQAHTPFYLEVTE